MIEKYYQIGGLVIKIIANKSDIYEHDDLLASFAVEKTEYHWECRVQLVDALPIAKGMCIYEGTIKRVFQVEDGLYIYIGTVAKTERDAHILLHRRNGVTNVLVKRSPEWSRVGEKTILRAMELEHLFALYHGVLLHAACICVDGNAILFTAVSGTGKSTQAALWEQLRGATVINGDRILIRSTGDAYKAWGVPYSGSSGICQQACLPLRAVICLKQAPETHIRRISGTYAFRQIWEGCTVQIWDQWDVDNCVSCILEMFEQVPIYELACTPDQSAVLALEKALKGELPR
jgi:hypothetical protein